MIWVPPLRERKEDIIFLAKRFLEQTGRELGREVHGFTDEAVELLLSYGWPGNVRELKNVMKRATLLCEGAVEPHHLSVGRLTPAHVPLNTELAAGIRRGLSLREIKEKLGCSIRGFSDMRPEEISRLTGLDLETACLASKREFDEPFIVVGKKRTDLDALFKSARQRGLTITKGGRFYHLQGKNDKGKAMEKIISWYKHEHMQVFSIGLGDSPNDFSMLELADFPVLIRSQREFPELKGQIPRLRVTREIGPKGWNKAILDILGKKEEKRNV